MIQRSDDGGLTWEPVGNQFVYDGVPGTHQWYDGTPHPWEFARVWHLEPSLSDPDTVLAGVEDAALFRSTDGGKSWTELSGLREHDTGPAWQPGAGGMCLHTIIVSPEDPDRIFVAISSAGAFRSDDGGEHWRPINHGLHSEGMPDEDAEVGHCVHRIALHPSHPDVLYMQKHWDVMRSDNAGDSWCEVSGNLPSDFGFAIDVHAHEPETVYVVPITSDSEHFPPEGKLRVYRSRTRRQRVGAAHQGTPPEQLLRRRAARRDGRGPPRLVRRVLRHDRWSGLRVGQLRGQVGADRARSSRRAVGRSTNVGMIRVVLPAHLRTLAQVNKEIEVEVVGVATQRSVFDAVEARYPVLLGTIRDVRTQERRKFVRFFACEDDLSHDRPTRRCPTRS